MRQRPNELRSFELDLPLWRGHRPVETIQRIVSVTLPSAWGNCSPLIAGAWARSSGNSRS